MEQVVHIVCAAYSFVPTEHVKESAFLLMFRRDVYTPLVQLCNPKQRYVANDKSLVALDPVPRLLCTSDS